MLYITTVKRDPTMCGSSTWEKGKIHGERKRSERCILKREPTFAGEKGRLERLGPSLAIRFGMTRITRVCHIMRWGHSPGVRHYKRQVLYSTALRDDEDSIGFMEWERIDALLGRGKHLGFVIYGLHSKSRFIDADGQHMTKKRTAKEYVSL